MSELYSSSQKSELPSPGVRRPSLPSHNEMLEKQECLRTAVHIIPLEELTQKEDLQNHHRARAMSGTSQVSEMGATQSMLSVASAHYRRSVIEAGNSSRRKLSSQRKKSTRHLAESPSRASFVQSSEGANDLIESICHSDHSLHSPPNQ